MNENDEWIGNIKNELALLGFGYMVDAYIPDNGAFQIIKQRLVDSTKQNILAKISATPKISLYQHLINNHCVQFYLRKRG